MAQWRGRLGTPASGRHSPPKAGGGKDSQFRGGPFSAGVSAFGGIRTREWQTPFVAVRATCLHSVKADGKEPPVTLGVAVSGPTGKNPHDRVLRTPRREENGRHSRWPGAASSSLVSRSRACRPEAGPVLPVGAPSRPCHGAAGYTPSHLLGVCAETGAIPAIGAFAAAALRAAVPAGGRRSKPSPPWRRQLYALSGPSALSACARGCYSRQPVGGRCPPSTPRHGDQRPRVTRNRHPRQQVAMPWHALRAVSMRNAGRHRPPSQARRLWSIVGVCHAPTWISTTRPAPPSCAAIGWFPNAKPSNWHCACSPPNPSTLTRPGVFAGRAGWATWRRCAVVATRGPD